MMAVEYHFVQTPSEDHFCPVCTDPLTDPFLIIQCGHHLCGTCRDRLIASRKKECPVCRVPDCLQGAAPNRHMKRLVNSLTVHCEHHSIGCTWTGELRNLQEHLDPARRKCDHVLVTCSFGCGQQVRSGEMKKHKSNRCPKRPTTCGHCGYHNARDNVMNEHYPICLQYPVKCPNKCKTIGLKRRRLDAHKNECPLQKISCPFNAIGCDTQLSRKDLPSHMKEGMEQHLLLMLQQMSQNKKPAATLPTSTTCEPHLLNLPPIEFTMTDFLQKKEANTRWNSPPFYTHPQGYKMCLKVDANGDGDGEGTHLSVFVTLMRGEHDKHLEWPFEGDIDIELVNWREDKNHKKGMLDFSRKNIGCCSRVTDTDIGDGWGYPQLIPHTSLVYTSTNDGDHEYLQDDCLRLRVKEVAVYSTPLFHKTPSWQDHLNPSQGQSVCEFTVTEFSKRKQFNNEHISPPFYTHTHGFKMCLKMYANGNGDSKGTHVSLYACLMEGEHDDHLVWPFRGEVTMELINWREDKGHHQMTITLNSTTDPDNEYICRMYNGAISLGLGRHQFISHSSLSYNSTTNTEYLQDDCLRLRVKKVVVNSK